ncbi:MAG TPA: hypothetical protein PK513_09480 [Alphaproteobacteria bacterium]|nr:hypothetical protein [Alphaproteobacteria bacterium]USO04704.1 MAG: hypothetical protein H6859_05915 [Rhodospirillales bacterium]HOO82722.1 hypothetical protein [Alphaproteobacteria bacterium]
MYKTEGEAIDGHLFLGQSLYYGNEKVFETAVRAIKKGFHTNQREVIMSGDLSCSFFNLQRGENGISHKLVEGRYMSLRHPQTFHENLVLWADMIVPDLVRNGFFGKETGPDKQRAQIIAGSCHHKDCLFAFLHYGDELSERTLDIAERWLPETDSLRKAISFAGDSQANLKTSIAGQRLDTLGL